MANNRSISELNLVVRSLERRVMNLEAGGVSGDPNADGSVDLLDNPVSVSHPTDAPTEDHSNSAIYCDHANEMPAQCPCPDDCYCKSHSCKRR